MCQALRDELLRNCLGEDLRGFATALVALLDERVSEEEPVAVDDAYYERVLSLSW